MGHKIKNIDSHIKSVNEFKSKEIYKVRDKLFETLKQRTAIDIMLRQKQILIYSNYLYIFSIIYHN